MRTSFNVKSQKSSAYILLVAYNYLYLTILMFLGLFVLDLWAYVRRTT